MPSLYKQMVEYLRNILDIELIEEVAPLNEKEKLIEIENARQEKELLMQNTRKHTEENEVFNLQSIVSIYPSYKVMRISLFYHLLKSDALFISANETA